jgi:putative SOS response-associated peptidase YedK
MTNLAIIAPPAVVIRSFITTAATGVRGKIHTKMPVILLLEDEDEWLNPDIRGPGRLLPLLRQYPDKEIEAYPVSSIVNRPTVDSAEVIKPVIN